MLLCGSLLESERLPRLLGCCIGPENSSWDLRDLLLGKAGQPGQPMMAPYKAALSAETPLTKKLQEG